MDRNISLYINFIFVIILVSLTQSVFAQCDCAISNICRSFEYADDVVVGIVKEKDTIKGYKVSTFEIEKSYKGELKGEILIRNDLVISQRYILYPKKLSENFYSVFGCCSRDKKIEDAAGEIKFLESLKNGKSKNMVYGVVRNHSDKTPIKTSIQVIGKDKNYQFFTDENGAYQVLDLPFGIYQFRPDLQSITFENIYRPPKTKEITLKFNENTCWEINILAKDK